MSITVTLKVNSSPVEKIGKTLSTGTDYPCVLKDDCSILKPVLDISSSDNIATFNYMYIPTFSRYYFIDDIISLYNDMWRVSGHIDVLETYKDKILNNSAILEGTQQTAIDNYLIDENVFKVNCKHSTDIIPFSSGLLDSGQFILITAGG